MGHKKTHGVPPESVHPCKTGGTDLSTTGKRYESYCCLLHCGLAVTSPGPSWTCHLVNTTTPNSRPQHQSICAPFTLPIPALLLLLLSRFSSPSPRNHGLRTTICKVAVAATFAARLHTDKPIRIAVYPRCRGEEAPERHRGAQDGATLQIPGPPSRRHSQCRGRGRC